jgi:hypothetical protein
MMKTILILVILMTFNGCAGESFVNHKKKSKDYHEYCPGDVLVSIDKYGMQHICEV